MKVKNGNCSLMTKHAMARAETWGGRIQEKFERIKQGNGESETSRVTQKCDCQRGKITGKAIVGDGDTVERTPKVAKRRPGNDNNKWKKKEANRNEGKDHGQNCVRWTPGNNLLKGRSKT